MPPDEGKLHEPWQRNPNFSIVTLRWPGLFPERRAWVRRVLEVWPSGWVKGSSLEYASEQEMARIAIKEKFGG